MAVEAPSTDKARLEELYRLHGDDIARWAARLGGPVADMDDLVQEVFLVVARRFREFRGEARLATWLFGITANVVRNRRRSDRRWGWLKALAEQAASALPAVAGDPGESMDRAEERARFYRILDRLNEAERTALILFEIEGLSGQEVAQLTGVRTEVVWMRLTRARRRFLQLFKNSAGRK